jgi:hypothetical protein
MRTVFGFAIALSVAAFQVPAPAFAWGASGHRLIGVLALRDLPDDLPQFLKSDDAIWQAGELAREPDRWRGSGSVHDFERDPGHFINLDDDLTVLGGPSLSDLPKTRVSYDTALRDAGATQYKAGYLPYAIIDGWQQLRTDFAYWRVDVAGAKFTKDAKVRDWLERDRALHEMLALRDLGVWAHFVGDGSQPLHVSVHHDGWGDFPNPEGFTDKRGIHAHFEGRFVAQNIGEDDVRPLMAPYRDCSCAIEARTVGYLSETQSQVVPLYRLEKSGGFEDHDPQGKAFASARIAAGAAELRDMIVDAWKASGSAKVGFPGLSVPDVEAGTVDPLPSLQGED